MNTNLLFAVLAAAFLSLTIVGRTQTPETPLDDAKKAIAASNDVYFRSFETNDSSIFLARYAEDCRILVPDMSPLDGHDGARRFFRLAYDRIGLRGGRFITTRIYGDGTDYVTEEGVWQSFDARHVLFDNGKYLVLWKKTPQGWKMFRDSFSSDRPKN